MAPGRVRGPWTSEVAARQVHMHECGPCPCVESTPTHVLVRCGVCARLGEGRITDMIAQLVVPSWHPSWPSLRVGDVLRAEERAVPLEFQHEGFNTTAAVAEAELAEPRKRAAVERTWLQVKVEQTQASERGWQPDQCTVSARPSVRAEAP